MANIDNPKGFIYEGRLSDQSPPIHDYEMTASTTLKLGDPVKLVSGYISKAVTGDTILGVFVGPAAQDGEVADYVESTGLVAGAGEHPLAKIVLALPDVLFRVQDVAASPTIAVRGVLADFAGASGAVEVNSGVSTQDDCLLFDKAEGDNIAGNAYGASMDWLVIFQVTVFNGHTAA